MAAYGFDIAPEELRDNEVLQEALDRGAAVGSVGHGTIDTILSGKVKSTKNKLDLVPISVQSRRTEIGHAASSNRSERQFHRVSAQNDVDQLRTRHFPIIRVDRPAGWLVHIRRI